MVTEHDLKEIAALCYLSVEDHEWETLIQDMDRLLTFAKTIDNAEVNAADPSAPLLVDSGRKDVITPSLPADLLLAGAASSQDGFFVVKKGEGV